MVQLTIDGARHSGGYRVDCDCNESWTGRGAWEPGDNFNPAAPVAWAAIHARLLHPGERVDLRFTERFSAWLEHYWTRMVTHRQVPPTGSGFGF